MNGLGEVFDCLRILLLECEYIGLLDHDQSALLTRLAVLFFGNFPILDEVLLCSLELSPLLLILHEKVDYRNIAGVFGSEDVLIQIESDSHRLEGVFDLPGFKIALSKNDGNSHLEQPALLILHEQLPVLVCRQRQVLLRLLKALKVKIGLS